VAGGGGLAERHRFRELDHPRDRLGRFVEVGGTVTIRGGGLGTVLETVGDGRIRVRRESDGREVVLDAGLTTQVRTAAQNTADPGPATPTDPPIRPVPGPDTPTRDELRAHLYEGLNIADPDLMKKGWSDEHAEVMRSVEQSVADLAARMGDDPALWDGQDPREKVHEALAQWVSTSNGNSPVALARQENAAELFGLTDVMPWTMTPELRSQVDTTKATNRAFDRAFLTAQYDATQQWFAERGITEIELHRGNVFGWETPAWFADGPTDGIPLRPLSSYTADRKRADDFSIISFGETTNGATISGTVPVERILSTPRTGLGELGEDEFVILGGPGTWSVTTKSVPDLPAPSGMPVGQLRTPADFEQAIAGATGRERRRQLMTRVQLSGLPLYLIPDNWLPDGRLVGEPEDVPEEPDWINGDPRTLIGPGNDEATRQRVLRAMAAATTPERRKEIVRVANRWMVPDNYNWRTGELDEPKGLGLSVKVIGGRLVTVVEAKAKLNFRETDHPRDRLGRFVEVGGTVSLRGGGTGTVLSTEGSGRVRVKRTDGREVVVDAGLTTQIRSADENRKRGITADAPETAPAADPAQQAVPGAPEEPDADPAATAATAREVVQPPSAPAQPPPAGSTPAPDADPAGAVAHLATPDGGQQAWLRTDEGDTPVGYLRTDANDPNTTMRFDDAQVWAEETDSRGLEATDDVPTGPTAGARTPAPADQAQPDVATDDAVDPTSPSIQAPTSADRAPTTETPEHVTRFLHEGLGENIGTYREAGGEAGDPLSEGSQTREVQTATVRATKQAKVETAAELTDRMRDVPDEAMLGKTDLALLARLEAGESVYLRMPYHIAHPGVREPQLLNPDSPNPGEELANWEFREVPMDRWNQIQAAGAKLPEATERVTPEQYRGWKRNERVANAISLWSLQSNGTNENALALQETAQELFGLDNIADWSAFEFYPDLRGQVDEAKTRNRAFNEAFLLAQYDATQDRFKAAGITSIELFRGFLPSANGEDPEWFDLERGNVPLRPLSSFSSSEGIAGSFSRSTTVGDGVVISSTVPVERIISSPRTGFGALSEEEFVVLGGNGEFNVRRAGEQDGPALDTQWEPIGELDDSEFDSGDAEPFDPTTESVGFIATRGELATAIAAAEDPQRRADLTRRAESLGMSDLIPAAWRPGDQDPEPGQLNTDPPAVAAPGAERIEGGSDTASAAAVPEGDTPGAEQVAGGSQTASATEVDPEAFVPAPVPDWLPDMRTISEADLVAALAYDNSSGDRFAQQQIDAARDELTRRADQVAAGLLVRYRKVEPGITAQLTAAATAAGGRMEGLEFRLKSRESLARKIRDKSIAKGATQSEYGAKIGDAVRYTMIVDPARYSEATRGMLDSFRDQGYEVIDEDNTWVPDSIYKGVNSVLRTPDGVLFELQFHTEDSFRVKMGQHVDYETMRDPARSAQEQFEAYERMRSNWEAIEVPEGVESVGNLLVRPNPFAEFATTTTTENGTAVGVSP
jgi:hypothetical protein